MATMRAAASQQAPALLDGPSTSGRCLCTPSVVYARRGRRLCLVSRASSHMPIGLHNVQPLPDFEPPPVLGVVKGSRTTATPRLTPERVGGRRPCREVQIKLLLWWLPLYGWPDSGHIID